MEVAVGIDLAKQVHWVVARSSDGAPVLNRKLDNTPTAISELIDELAALAEPSQVTVGIDVLGGIAGLLTAMLADTGLPCVHVPGLAVNRARRATRGGEAGSSICRNTPARSGAWRWGGGAGSGSWMWRPSTGGC